MTDPKVRALHERIAELEAELRNLNPEGAAARAAQADFDAAHDEEAALGVKVVPTPKRSRHAAPTAKR